MSSPVLHPLRQNAPLAIVVDGYRQAPPSEDTDPDTQYLKGMVVYSVLGLMVLTGLALAVVSSARFAPSNEYHIGIGPVLTIVLWTACMLYGWGMLGAWLCDIISRRIGADVQFLST